MSEIAFMTFLFGSGIAATAAYALVMSVLQREINRTWTCSEALILLVASAVSVFAGYDYLGAGSMFDMAAAWLLVASLTLVSIVLWFHRMSKAGAPFEPGTVSKLKTTAFLLLGVHLLQVLALFAGIAGW